jgi:hypothetical protein
MNPPGSRTEHPERWLLVSCSRTQMEPELEVQVRTLLETAALDWTSLIQQARMHGVISLLHHHLSRLNFECVPPDSREILQTLTRNALLRTLQQVAGMRQILELLTSRQINALLYKGPSLAQLAYRQIGLRQSGDLDILVDSSQLKAARDAILSLGYELILKPHAEEDGRVYQGYDLLHPTSRIAVDLQDRFGIRNSSFALTFDELWQRHQVVGVGGVDVPTLSNEDYLLVLCAHGAQHRWGYVKWICDIGELLRASPTLDWTWIFERAQTLQTERILNLGLLLAEGVGGAALPNRVKAPVSTDKVAQAMVDEVYYWMFHEVTTLSDLLRLQWFALRFDLRLRKQLRNKVKNTFFILSRRIEPQDRDTSAVKLPRSLRVLYYVFRPVRILADYRFGRHQH